MTRRHGSNKTEKRAMQSALILGTCLLALSSATMATDTSLSSSPVERHIVYLNESAWINDIGTLVYADPDEDGYFSGLSLSIDADSSYNQYEVYAIVDIINELNEAERLHTTQPFHIYGRSITDEYRIDIDLVQNYYPGVYDLQVALVDAHDNRILDQVDANDFRNLRALPLESEDNQTINIPVIERPVNAPNDDIRVVEYAGSTGFGIMIILLMSGLFRIFRTGNKQL